MARTTEIDPGTLLQQLAPDVLQEIPDGNFAPGMLTQLWSLHANQAEQRNVAELALELNPDYAGPRRLIGVGDPRQAKLKEEERRRQESPRLYEETMRVVQERSELLLQRIDERMRIDRKKLQELDERALRLHDGRAVYVGPNGTYQDGQGSQLQGKDKSEAAELHRQNPDAPTWAQKEDLDHQLDALQRLKEKTQRLHDGAKGADGESLSPEDRSSKAQKAQSHLEEYEKEYDQRVARGDAATAQQEITDDTYGRSDYMAAYARSTSHAAGLDSPHQKTLSAQFTPAAEGQGNTASPDQTIPRATPNTASPANPSR